MSIVVWLLKAGIDVHCDDSSPVIVAADAPEHGIGAAQFSKFPEALHKAVSHALQTVTKTERV